MKQTKERIKEYFQTGDKPTQDHYYDTWDSFWHKDENIPQQQIEQLTDTLDAKLNANDYRAVGANGQVQFNSNNAFGSDENLHWDNTNKNLGIGTQSPMQKLDVGGNINADLGYLPIVKSHANSAHIQNPKGGFLSLRTGQFTGYFIIQLPFTVGTDYQSAGMVVEIGGQNQGVVQYNISFTWLTTSFSTLHVSTTADLQKDYVHTVRAATDGTNTFLIIGEDDTTFNRTYCVIKSVTTNYTGSNDAELWKSNFNIIGYQNDISGYTINRTVKGNYGATAASVTLTHNEWTTIAVLNPSSNDNVYGTIQINRYGNNTLLFDFAVDSYNNSYLFLRHCLMINTEMFQNIRITSDNKIQVKFGNNTNNTGFIVKLFNQKNSEISIGSAIGNETAKKSIQITAKETAHVLGI